MRVNSDHFWEAVKWFDFLNFPRKIRNYLGETRTAGEEDNSFPVVLREQSRDPEDVRQSSLRAQKLCHLAVYRSAKHCKSGTFYCKAAWTLISSFPNMKTIGRCWMLYRKSLFVSNLLENCNSFCRLNFIIKSFPSRSVALIK